MAAVLRILISVGPQPKKNRRESLPTVECLLLEFSQPPGSPVAAGLISGLWTTELIFIARGAFAARCALSPIRFAVICLKSHRPHQLIRVAVCLAETSDFLTLSIFIAFTGFRRRFRGCSNYMLAVRCTWRQRTMFAVTYKLARAYSKSLCVRLIFRAAAMQRLFWTIVCNVRCGLGVAAGPYCVL